MPTPSAMPQRHFCASEIGKPETGGAAPGWEAVRAGLRARGLRIPESLAEQHDTHTSADSADPSAEPGLADLAFDLALDLALTPGLHEWFPGDPLEGEGQAETGPTKTNPNGVWFPPLAVLIGLARRAVEASPDRRVLWIGRRCWPYPPSLVERRGPPQGDAHTETPTFEGDTRLLERSVFIDAGDASVDATSRARRQSRPQTGRQSRSKKQTESRSERVWAIELAARCAGVGLVIADGSGLSMAESRRLQLAAEHPGAPLLLARPPRDRASLSAARTRWAVAPLPPLSTSDEPHRQGWAIELLRCKGLKPRTTEHARRWTAHRDHATGAIIMEPHTGSAGAGGLAPPLVERTAPQAVARLA